MEPPDDIPPPPYSETDIYSPSGSSRHSAATPGSSADTRDDVSSVAASSSPGYNIIYTPPETPREGSPHPHYDYADHTGHVANPSARAYFESRPVHPSSAAAAAVIGGSSNADHLLAYISVSVGAGAEAGAGASVPPPYPIWAPARDVTEQDWHTFVNYLLPERAVAGARDDDSSAATTQGVEDVLRDWNAGFFGPRGVTVRLRDASTVTDASSSPSSPPVSSPVWEKKIPCTWQEEAAPSKDKPADEPASAATAHEEPRGADARGAAGRPGWTPFEINSRGGLRIGPLTIEGDRVAIGDSFQVDSQGVRWGGFSVGPGQPPVFGGQRAHHPGCGERSRGLGFGCRGGGRGGAGGVGGWGGGWGGPHVSAPGGFGVPWSPFDHAYGHGPDHNHPNPHPHHRSHSVSSASHSSSSPSSSSSDSGSDSDSDSIGSLPEYDDLKDSQLPIAKQSILAWLSHPEQPVTKSMLKAARADIRAAAARAKKAPNDNNPPYQQQQAQQLRQQQQADVARQRQEVKILLEQFKALKRCQRDTRRADRQRRRDEKKAARRARKVEKKARRAERRALKMADRAGRRARKMTEREVRRALAGAGVSAGVGGGRGILPPHMGTTIPQPQPQPQPQPRPRPQFRPQPRPQPGVHIPVPPMTAMPPMPHVPPIPTPGVPRGACSGPSRGGSGFLGQRGRRGGGGGGGGSPFGFRFGFGFGGRGRGREGRGGSSSSSSHWSPPWTTRNDQPDDANEEQQATTSTATTVLFDADNENMPGAWPNAAAAAAAGDEEGAIVPPAHLGAKYEAVDCLEAVMAARADELRTLRLRRGGGGRRDGDSDEEREKKGKGKEMEEKGKGKEMVQDEEKGEREKENDRLMETAADKLEEEVRRLGAEVERLRLEADEEFARALVDKGL